MKTDKELMDDFCEAASQPAMDYMCYLAQCCKKDEIIEEAMIENRTATQEEAERFAIILIQEYSELKTEFDKISKKLTEEELNFLKRWFKIQERY